MRDPPSARDPLVASPRRRRVNERTSKRPARRKRLLAGAGKTSGGGRSLGSRREGTDSKGNIVFRRLGWCWVAVTCFQLGFGKLARTACPCACEKRGESEGGWRRACGRVDGRSVQSGQRRLIASERRGAEQSDQTAGCSRGWPISARQHPPHILIRRMTTGAVTRATAIACAIHTSAHSNEMAAENRCQLQQARGGSQIPTAATCTATSQRIASLDHCAVRENNETNAAHTHIAAVRSLPSLSPLPLPSSAHSPTASASTPPAWSFVERVAGRRRKCNRQSNRRCNNRRRLLLLLLLLSLQTQPAHRVVAALGAAAAATPNPTRPAP